jgi:hypothetical protein
MTNWNKTLSLAAMWLFLVASTLMAGIAFYLSWETFTLVSLLFAMYSVALAVFAVVAVIGSK